MKKLFTLIIGILLSANLLSAKEIIVPGGVLNALLNAIAEAQDGDVLILEAGQIYPNQGSIDISKKITIRGTGTIEEGNLPYVKELPAADGSFANQTLQVLANFKIYNVFFNGYQGEAENQTNARAIRVNEPIDSFIVEGCVFEQYRKRTVDLNTPVAYTSITNTIFNHNWKIGGIDEGRAIDMRNGGHGTMIIEDCTFVNSSDRHIRHQQFGSFTAPVIEKLVINHCTFLNGGNYRSTFSFQSVGELVFTNNLVANPALFGTDTISNRKVELVHLEGSDAVTTPGPYQVNPFVLSETQTYGTTVDFSNNNIYTEAQIVEILNSGTQVSMPQLFNNEFLTVIDENTAYFEEKLEFTSAPPTPYQMITDFVTRGDEMGEGETNYPPYTVEYLAYDKLDLGYASNTLSATAASDGGQLGDRRWELVQVVNPGREINVPGGVLNALMDAVANAEDGDILILEAGQIYPNQGSIDISKKITIRGTGTIEEGNLPYIKELPAADGSYANQTLQVLADFSIYNVFFNGFQGEAENQTNARAIRVNQPIDNFIVEGCVFEQYRKRTVDLNTPVKNTSIKHTIFNHNWKIGGIDEGRAIDMRNGGHGTMLIEDCTFVNSSDRHIRHQQFGSFTAPVIEKLVINHCTFLNGGNYRSTFSFQSVGELVFTNNLVANPALFGTDTISNRKVELVHLEGSDAVTTPGPYEVNPFVLSETQTYGTTVDFNNNNIFSESEVIEILNSGTQVSMPQLFNNEFLTVIDENTAYFEEKIAFTSVPPTPLQMITDFVVRGDEMGAGETNYPPYTVVYMPYTMLDLGYPQNAQSATAASNGGQLGDRRWALTTSTSVRTLVHSMGLKVFPNPSKNDINIQFSLDNASKVLLTLFNVNGAVVRQSSNNYGAGEHTLTLERENLSSGIYFLNLTDGNKSDVIKLSIQ